MRDSARVISAAFWAALPLVAASTASAQPVDYVKVCNSYGEGFFAIPGSDTCLKIGGAVRLDVSAYTKAFYGDIDAYVAFVGAGGPYGAGALNNTFSHWNTLASLARARVSFDARSATEFGLLRSTAVVDFERGEYHESLDPVTLAPRSTAIDRTILREAYVQWGGLTAGLTYSYFNLPYFLTYTNPLTADQRATMLGYTFSSDAFSASLALEDPSTRRGVLLYPGLSPVDIGRFLAGAQNNYGGLRYPDIVGALRYNGSQLSLQASGALHHVNHVAVAGVVPSLDEWGWAAQIGGQLKFAERGTLYGGLVHTSGATNFAGVGADDERFGNGAAFGAIDGTYFATGRWQPTEVTSGHIGLGWSLSDQVRVAGSLGYARVTNDGRPYLPADPSNVDFDLYKAIGMIEWQPVKGFTIGLEGTYTRVNFDPQKSVTPVPGVTVITAGDYDRVSGLLRVQRRF